MSFSTSTFGKSTLSEGVSASLLSVQHVTPVDGAQDQDNITAIVFEVWTPGNALDFAETDISINGSEIVTAGVAAVPYTLSHSAITEGWRFTLTQAYGWIYGSTVTVDISILDVIGSSASYSGSFSVEADTTCFNGPLNTFEETLLVPFTDLPANEYLRIALIANLIDGANDTAAARALFLRAHTQELAPILRYAVTPPTTAEQVVTLCSLVTNVAVSDALRRKADRLPDAIIELQGLGLPAEHITLLQGYAADDQPNTEVPLACLVVLLAKALV